MADLGIYNFIQAALARGETKEQITAMLLKNGQPQASIDDAFAAVKRGKPPMTKGDIEKPARRSGLFMNILGTLAILLVAGGILLAFLVHGGIVRLPKPQEIMSQGVPSCAQPDDCVRQDVDKISAEAQTLHAYAGSSYAALCAGGIVNMEAASGTDAAATGINASLRNAVNDILFTRGAPSQQDAGVTCGSAWDRFYVSAAIQGANGPFYCVDSRGVATTSAPNTRTGFCGSVLSEI